jgi:hypothetical protein|tara:strand:- start:1236 stop:1400 length:165 start_codon:yes stop_codon:yes gene_type:complete
MLRRKIMNEYELIAYILVLSGVAYTSFKIGVTEGIQDAIFYFEEKGVIKLDKED